MGRLKKIASRIRKIDVSQIVESQILKNDDEVLDLNTENQLAKGIDAIGQNLPPYSQTSVTVFGKPSGSIRLLDEGDFYRGFFFEQNKFPFKVFSKDKKSEGLEAIYGEDIFGFTKDSKVQIKEIILDEVQKEFNSAVSKAFKIS